MMQDMLICNCYSPIKTSKKNKQLHNNHSCVYSNTRFLLDSRYISLTFSTILHLQFFKSHLLPLKENSKFHPQSITIDQHRELTNSAVGTAV